MPELASPRWFDRERGIGDLARGVRPQGGCRALGLGWSRGEGEVRRPRALHVLRQGAFPFHLPLEGLHRRLAPSSRCLHPTSRATAPSTVALLPNRARAPDTRSGSPTRGLCRLYVVMGSVSCVRKGSNLPSNLDLADDTQRPATSQTWPQPIVTCRAVGAIAIRRRRS